MRSQVSRVAMTALAEMFVTLKRNMDIVSIYIVLVDMIIRCKAALMEAQLTLCE